MNLIKKHFPGKFGSMEKVESYEEELAYVVRIIRKGLETPFQWTDDLEDTFLGFIRDFTRDMLPSIITGFYEYSEWWYNQEGTGSVTTTSGRTIKKRKTKKSAAIYVEKTLSTFKIPAFAILARLTPSITSEDLRPIFAPVNGFSACDIQTLIVPESKCSRYAIVKFDSLANAIQFATDWNGYKAQANWDKFCISVPESRDHGPQTNGLVKHIKTAIRPLGATQRLVENYDRFRKYESNPMGVYIC